MAARVIFGRGRRALRRRGLERDLEEADGEERCKDLRMREPELVAAAFALGLSLSALWATAAAAAKTKEEEDAKDAQVQFARECGIEEAGLAPGEAGLKGPSGLRAERTAQTTAERLRSFDPSSRHYIQEAYRKRAFSGYHQALKGR